MNNPITQTLPKCCPIQKQISGNGKACVEDDAKDFEYRVDGDGMNLMPDVLPITIENKTVFYKLDYTSQFNCVSHEVYVIRDDVVVEADGSVVIYDDYGENWTLAREEVCVDSVTVRDEDGLSPSRLFVALLCPSCGRVPCIHKCCSESQQLQLSQDDVQPQVECIPSSGKSWSQEFQENSSSKCKAYNILCS